MKKRKLMNRTGVLCLTLLLSMAMLFTACGNDAVNQEQQTPQQETQQTTTGQNQAEAIEQNAADPAGAEVQNEADVIVLQGVFQGLADGHSAEITVKDEAIVYQFYDEDIAAQLDIMEVGTAIQFEVTEDAETGMQVIVKLEETSAEQ